MSNEELQIPEFKPDVPRVLLAGVSDKDRYMFEQTSIQRQQNDWIIRQLAEGHRKFAQNDTEQAKIRTDLDTLLHWKTVLTSKGAVFALIIGTLLVPIGLMWIGAAIARWFEQLPKH